MKPTSWNPSPPAENDPPTAGLPEGTRVGPWRLLRQTGRGSYGVVYRAERAGQEKQGPVALKLALAPEDARFEREVELLSRLHHEAVPKLRDSGHWRPPGGGLYPYLAMEWVEGTPLYEWADGHIPTSRQVLQWLAQLARALQATHQAGGVHRDVKGDNVLVRHEDGRVFLIDFGASRHEGASPLTSRALPPGSAAYRPPEAWRAAREEGRHSPGPADDLFALGVTGYRLVTGGYPPSTHPADEESYVWGPGRPGPRAPQDVTRRCCKELSDLLQRMLSVDPRARGSAGELAEALEEAARSAGPEADRPLWVWPVAPRPEPAQAPRAKTATREPARARRAWLGAAALALGVLLGRGVHWPEPSTTPPPQEGRDGGSAGLAEEASAGPGGSLPEPHSEERITLEIPPKPFPGQVAPEPDGRCRRISAVPINGGCWLPIETAIKDCRRDGFYEYQGRCYLPMFPPPRKPVSSSARDNIQP